MVFFYGVRRTAFRELTRGRMRFRGKIHCRRKFRDCPWVPSASSLSILLWKNPAWSSSGPDIGPLSRHSGPLVQLMSLFSSGKFSLFSDTLQLVLCPDLYDLLWAPGSCQGHMAAMKRNPVSGGSGWRKRKHMLLRKRATWEKPGTLSN